MKNLILGVSRSLPASRLHNWMASASRLADSEVHLICLDKEVAPEMRAQADKYGVVIVHLPNEEAHVHHVRYHSAWDYTRRIDKFDNILWTDVSDVVFQCTDLEWMDKLLEEHMYFCGSEGVLFSQEPWNSDNLRRTFPHHFDDMVRREILCSGVIGGWAECMTQLFWIIYNLSRNIKTHEIVDQSALNVMMLVPSFEKSMKVVNTDGDELVHLAVSGPTQFFKGWGFDKAYKYGLPSIVEGQVVNHAGKPFKMVHQYNRIPEWEAAINARHAH